MQIQRKLAIKHLLAISKGRSKGFLARFERDTLVSSCIFELIKEVSFSGFSPAQKYSTSFVLLRTSSFSSSFFFNSAFTFLFMCRSSLLTVSGCVFRRVAWISPTNENPSRVYLAFLLSLLLVLLLHLFFISPLVSPFLKKIYFCCRLFLLLFAFLFPSLPFPFHLTFPLTFSFHIFFCVSLRFQLRFFVF